MIEATRGGSVGGDGFISSSSRFLLPFAPENTNDWTEDMFAIYHEVQIAVGLRKEVTEEEAKSQELLQDIDEAIESGEGNWLDKVKGYFGEGSDEEFDFLVGNEDVVANITKELEEAEENYDYEF